LQGNRAGSEAWRAARLAAVRLATAAPPFSLIVSSGRRPAERASLSSRAAARPSRGVHKHDSLQNSRSRNVTEFCTPRVQVVGGLIELKAGPARGSDVCQRRLQCSGRQGAQVARNFIGVGMLRKRGRTRKRRNPSPSADYEGVRLAFSGGDHGEKAALLPAVTPLDGEGPGLTALLRVAGLRQIPRSHPNRVADPLVLGQKDKVTGIRSGRLRRRRQSSPVTRSA
jgi:hypothetical protein